MQGKHIHHKQWPVNQQKHSASCNNITTMTLKC